LLPYRRTGVSTPLGVKGMTLTEKYRPKTFSDFVGLDKPKRWAQRITSKPYASSWLFVGDAGVGKTSLALALTELMPAELHHIPSQSCTVERLRKEIDNCYYVPRLGCRFHIVLIDEANKMSDAAQLYLLSKMDESDRVPDTIFIFTCNDAALLLEPFQSRCIQVPFSSHGATKEAAETLELIWDLEASPDAPRPNFARIAGRENMRAAILELEKELMLA
jgi:DNA polymerase III delta prime subunit